MRTQRQHAAGIIIHWVLRLLLLVLLIAGFSLAWADQNFGTVSFDEVVFHAMMPLQGTSANMVGDYVSSALVPALMVWAALMLLACFPVTRSLVLQFGEGEKAKAFSIFPLRIPAVPFAMGLVGMFALVLWQANRKFDFVTYVKNQLQSSALIEEEYVNPEQADITFPEKKRNLICIYMESAESSNQDTANGGLFPVNFTPEMTRLARENISFSQSEKIEGSAMAPDTEWTMGGIVAETAGLPLKLPANYNNVMGSYEYFMPGVISLGDILEEAGYRNYFMCGSDAAFGGRREYFLQHGNYALLDYGWAKREGLLPEDYHVWWGYEDQKLYAFAKEKLLEIGKSGEPFNFSMLTADTHNPSGYVCSLCGSEYGEKYANVWACASRQVWDFVEWIKAQDFYENTTIVITGDHESMNPGFYGADAKDIYPGENRRKVYEAFVNPAAEPVKENNRRFTTMDLFPTILAGLGAEIRGERLGLGTNLFSGEETLSEKYGYEYLYAELRKQSPWYNRELLFRIPQEE